MFENGDGSSSSGSHDQYDQEGHYVVGGSDDSGLYEVGPFNVPLTLKRSVHSLEALPAADAHLQDYSSRISDSPHQGDIHVEIDHSGPVSLKDYNDVQLGLQAELNRLELIYGDNNGVISNPIARQRAADIEYSLRNNKAQFDSKPKQLTYHALFERIKFLEESMKSTGRLAQKLNVFSFFFPVTGRNNIKAIRLSIEGMMQSALVTETSKDIFRIS